MMTREEVHAWFAAHRTVSGLIHAATDDYVGARCCVINWLIPIGFVLGALAAEKYLKAFLLCAGQRQLGKHAFESLLERVAAIQPELSKFRPMMTMLTYAYAERYGTNMTGRVAGYSSADLALLDDFVVTMLEHIAIPEEVMCSLLPFHWLFEDRFARAGWKVRDWLTVNNAPMATRLPAWRLRYDEIMDQLHPNRVK
jgi:hypothetical protein